MLVLGDTYAGKTSLIHALASHYLDDNYPSRTNTVDIYGWHLSDSGNISFATDGKKESLRVWELAAQKFYRAFHRSLIKKDTLTLVVIDGERPRRAVHALKEWSFFCDSVGISDPIIVVTKADKTDRTAELRVTVPNAFFVSAKADSEELSRLRATIVRRAAESVETADIESERLIKAVKVLTQIDDSGVSQVVRVIETFRIKDPYSVHGVFLPDTISTLLRGYSTFLLSSLTDQSLSAQGICQLCTREISDTVSRGQCLSQTHGRPKRNRLLPSSLVQLFDDCDPTCSQILNNLTERRVLYPVHLPGGELGYFFPYLHNSHRLPEPIRRGIKITYSDSELHPLGLFDEIFDLIMRSYSLVWNKACIFGVGDGCVKAQFSVQGVEGLINLFEFRSYVIVDLPPTLDVGDLLGPRFQWVEGVEPRIGKGNCTSQKWKLVVNSEW